jgi:predicted dehydrogenase/threonine dehydrogenase-like Zn-dependent dehydrogenase
MKILVQDLGTGTMGFLESVHRAPRKREVLIETWASAVSVGTELRTVKDARKGLIAKAMSRKKEVGKVIALARDQGIGFARRTVADRLATPSPLGYSAFGRVLAVGPEVRSIRVGDMVAAGGNTANHATHLVVPEMLCVPVRGEVDARDGAMVTICSIALQGIRQARASIGERVAVIGLGLVGLITVRLLDLAGVEVIGLDVSESAVERARALGYRACLADSGQATDLEHEDLEGWMGQDSVILCASTTSDEPINAAGRMARKGGRIVIVGAVGTGFDRATYYRKELEVVMSSSYGPGRHVRAYEEDGQDFAVEEIRWTERRNMESVLRLMERGRLTCTDLVTETVPFADLPASYDAFAGGNGLLGVVALYPVAQGTEAPLRSNVPSGSIVQLDLLATEPVVGIIGAGSFARTFGIPALKKAGARIKAVACKATVGEYLVQSKGIETFYPAASDLLEDAEVNTVCVYTRHDSHSNLSVRALEAGKSVLVEKPLGISDAELTDVLSAAGASKGLLCVGYNRRWSPAIKEMRAWCGTGPGKSILARVYAKDIPLGHWVHDPKVGGGRVIGEVCHFLDLGIFLSGSAIQGVDARYVPHRIQNDRLVVSLTFANGDVMTLLYYSGLAKVPKEYFEVHAGGRSAMLDDYRTLTRTDGSSSRVTRYRRVDKGHEAAVAAFLAGVRSGSPPIPYEELENGMRATLLAAARAGTSA